ncbi:MAG TPA: uroporphyrinogen-III C-methyltransferase [Bryobacteraceae bacterium]|nr:uroporphyrinogen-III C-methyltransferase [Bryobacteraceae bacterium]
MSKVYLIGAGPGDPDLLTVKAQRVLRSVDVVLYDRLVSAEVLAVANPSAELIYVGKNEGEQDAVQQVIFDLMLDRARAGNSVARLKGGDACIFGRGGEEWLHLARNGVQVEVIPGISSALAAPALAGVPLTYRGVSRGFAIVTGHCAGRDPVDWADYARVDTLVILMGVKDRAHIAHSLIRAGRREDEPAVFIERATTAEERVRDATLGDVAAGGVEVESPAVFVIGAVAALRAELAACAAVEVLS